MLRPVIETLDHLQSEWTIQVRQETPEMRGRIWSTGKSDQTEIRPQFGQSGARDATKGLIHGKSGTCDFFFPGSRLDLQKCRMSTRWGSGLENLIIK